MPYRIQILYLDVHKQCLRQQLNLWAGYHISCRSLLTLGSRFKLTEGFNIYTLCIKGVDNLLEILRSD